uniref:F-box domain-containing protein n=1 Tax=Mycena chlorophos TaxID=658473 RepID=A0ABQ0LJL3_MYCCL|nr:predicted protein [Mycena chlorophos]
MLDRLPLELVIDIFRLCLVDNGLDKVKSNEAPLLLGRVCSSWRTAVLCAPVLWSTFHVNCMLRTRLDSMKNIADLWLSRSGTHPLDVAVAVQSLADASVTPLLSILGQHAPHTRSFHLYTCTDDFKPLEAFRMDFRILEHLAIDVMSLDEEVSPWPADATVRAFSLATALSVISLHGSRIPSLCFALPWARVTSFDAPPCGVDELLRILEYLANLAHLYITVDDWDGIQQRGTPLRHSHLRTFFCKFFSRNRPIFLESLILPSLDALAILPSEDSVPLCLDLLERSSGRLKMLKLYPRRESAGHPLPEISLFKQPSLSGLQKLDIVAPDPVAFEAFCNALVSHPGFLPELRALAVGTREEDLADYTRQIVELVGLSLEKRVVGAGCSNLRSLRVAWSPKLVVDVEPLVLKSFQAVKGSGVEVYVGGDSKYCLSLV